LKPSTWITWGVLLLVLSLFIWGTFLVALGSILLLIGIIKHFMARKLTPDEQKSKNTEPISISNLFEPFFSIADATVRIFRNKRRSMAMLSGIVLGTLIISSIFIYTDVLEREIYESMVQGIPYEASFSLNEPGNESSLWAFADQIANDPRVESVTVFAGGVPGGDSFYSEGGASGIFEQPTLRLNAKIDGDSLEQTADRFDEGGDAINPVFVRDNFIETSIYEKIIGERIEGEFDLSTGLNRTVIPRSLALRMNLQVGDVLSGINITLLSYKTSESIETRFENVTIAGINEDPEGSWDEEKASETIYFNSGMMPAESQLRKKFEEYRLFTLAVKINKDEFNTGNLESMSGQVDRLVNDITRDTGDALSGNNIVGMVLMLSSLMGYVLIFIDIVLIVPIVVLTIYLLIYGLELSLEERKKEIGILKVQGANGKQIFGQVISESFLIFVLGLALGYILAILGAWVISSSAGFMNFNFSLSYLIDFIIFDKWAFLMAFFAIGAITLISIRKRGRKFIDLQVSEAVQMMEWKKKGFLRRNKIDIILFGFGFISALKTILDQVFDRTSIFGINLSMGAGWDIFLFGFLGTIALWIGGAFSAPVLAKWIALKLETITLKIKMFKDIGPIIKSGLKRRGDVVKLVFIISLTLSIASLAVIQGYSDEKFTIRELEYQIGADYQVRFSNGSDHAAQVLAVSGVDKIMSLPSLTVEILSSSTVIYGIDAENASFALWHFDSFEDESSSGALRKLARDDSYPGVYVGSSIANNVGAEKGDIITLKVRRTDAVTGNDTTEKLEVRVLGEFDHAPGGISGDALLADHSTILKIRSLMNDHNIKIRRTAAVADGTIPSIMTDNSPDTGVRGGLFAFNISVSDTIDVDSVEINWTHGNENENTSLFPMGDHWVGWIELDDSIRNLTYTIYIRDESNNTNISSMQMARIGDFWNPGHVIDFSRNTATMGGTFQFNISLGGRIDVDSVRANWDHGGKNGGIILTHTNGFYVGSINLYNDPRPLTYTISVVAPPADLGSTNYLVDISSGASRGQLTTGLNKMEGVTNVIDLEHELDNIGNEMNWGIPGLLTMMFIVALIASLTISFTFSSIIMKRRLREFAVLQTLGASRGQVYKIAISENAVLMMVSVIWGIMIGLGLSFMMNGFLEIVGELLGRGGLERVVFIPWLQLIFIALATFVGMVLAVALSAISAARQDLSVATRVI